MHRSSYNGHILVEQACKFMRRSTFIKMLVLQLMVYSICLNCNNWIHCQTPLHVHDDGT